MKKVDDWFSRHYFIRNWYLFSNQCKTYSFDNVASIDQNKVTSIQIEHDNERVMVEKKADIQKLLKEFSGMKLKKTNETKKLQKSLIGSECMRMRRKHMV